MDNFRYIKPFLNAKYKYSERGRINVQINKTNNLGQLMRDISYAFVSLIEHLLLEILVVYFYWFVILIF